MTERLVVIVLTGILAVSALLALLRMVRGPSIVDRAVANEVLVGVLICALGVEAAVTRHDTTLPILISLSLVGFLASVAVARFVGGDFAPNLTRDDLRLAEPEGEDIEIDDLDGDFDINDPYDAGDGLDDTPPRDHAADRPGDRPDPEGRR